MKKIMFPGTSSSWSRFHAWYDSNFRVWYHACIDGLWVYQGSGRGDTIPCLPRSFIREFPRQLWILQQNQVHTPYPPFPTYTIPTFLPLPRLLVELESREKWWVARASQKIVPEPRDFPRPMRLRTRRERRLNTTRLGPEYTRTRSELEIGRG